MKDYVKRPISIRKFSILTAAVYAASLIPLLWIALYASPSADDIPESYAAYTAFRNSGSFFAAIAAAAGKSLYYYFNWMGYFTSNFFTCLPFSVFGERFYGFGTWFILAVYTFSGIFFMKALLIRIFHMDKYSARAVIMLALILSIQCMPAGGARVEAFFWYCGAAGYTLMYSFCLLFLGLLIHAAAEENKGRRTRNLVLACVIGFFAGGGSYLSAITTALVTFLWLLGAFVRWKMPSENPDLTLFMKRSRILIVPAVFLAAGFFLSCAAPGNANRASTLTGMGPLKAVLVSIYYVLSYAIGEWTTWAVICIMLLMLPVFWNAAGSVRFVFRHPVSAAVLAFAIPAASITPVMYAVGNIGAGRMQAMFWMHFVLCMTLLEGYLTGWFYQTLHGIPQKQGMQPIPEDRECNRKFPAVSSVFLRFIGFLILFGSLLCVYTNRDYYTASSAVEDLANGHASVYAEENKERYSIFTDQKISDAIVKSYTYKPDLLFFSDFSADSTDWTNQAAAKYYGKNSVIREDP
jgi:hypothetical protein